MRKLYYADKYLGCVYYFLKAHRDSFFLYFFNVAAKIFACGVVLRLIQHVVAHSAKCVCLFVFCRSV